MQATKWRLGITLLAIAIGVGQLMPWEDKPYDTYLTQQVKSNKAQFQSVLQTAQTQVKEHKAPNLIQALVRICKEQKLDLSTCFTQFNAADIKNFDKRNQILLQHLLHQSQSVFKQGLDLKGGVAFSLSINPQVLEGKSDWECEKLVQKAIEVITTRIDALGVAEPIVRPYGRNNIEIQLPGISLETHPDIVGALKKPAKLDFRLVNEDADPNGPIPLGYERLIMEQEDEQGQWMQIPLVVKRIPEMTGKAIKEAHPVVDAYGKYEVSLQMTAEGKERFASITRQNLHRRLAIVLDGVVCSAPVIQSEITGGQASISGRFTQRDAIELSNVLNNPLEFELELAEIYEIGPSLATSAKNIAIYASLAGLVLLITVMSLYYRLPGMLCSLSLLLNAFFIFVSWAILGATITLPSITALALTLGMAVDANILIFERVREELRAGINLTTALNTGHKKAFIAILDSNLTTLLTAGLLVLLGSGAVKGFGITLAAGILTTLFSVLCFNRALLKLLVHTNHFHLPQQAWFQDTKINFLAHLKGGLCISCLLALIGCAAFGIQGKGVLSIDFVGGDELLVQGDRMVDCQKIRDLAKQKQLGTINAVYQKNLSSASHLLKIQTEKGRGMEVFSALQASEPEVHFTCVSKNQIGASISSDVQKHAILSIAFALIGILAYIAVRFEWTYGISSVLALTHDTLITMGLYVAFGHQFTAPMIAAVLLVIGYSINDKIIIFDRVREELAANRSMPLNAVINHSINKTLSRTLMTSLTTFIPTSLLYICCSGIVRDYALVFLLGIVIGTFSSIFVAMPLFYKLNHGNRTQLDHPQTAKHAWEQA